MNDYKIERPDKLKPAPARASSNNDHVPHSLGEAPKQVYVLYLLGLLFFFTVPVGALMAYQSRERAGAIERSHLDLQIRLFWVSVAALVAGAVCLSVSVGLGALILLGWLAWVTWATVRGLWRYSKGQAAKSS